MHTTKILVKLRAFLCLSPLLLPSCTDDCTTCTIETPSGLISEEFCDDETNYTDQFGEIITYEQAIKLQESLGYTCE